MALLTFLTSCQNNYKNDSVEYRLINHEHFVDIRPSQYTKVMTIKNDIEYLNIQYVNVLTINELSKIISDFKNVKSIFLSNNFYGKELFHAINKDNNPNLETLSIDSMKITELYNITYNLSGVKIKVTNIENTVGNVITKPQNSMKEQSFSFTIETGKTINHDGLTKSDFENTDIFESYEEIIQKKKLNQK